MLTGFILAAGFGTRLKPLTDHVPKPLVDVCAKPLLQRSLELYKRCGIKRIGVNSHYFPEQISAFKNSSSIPFELFHESGAIRGTGGALYFAKDFLIATETFLISNVDIVANLDLGALHEKFLASDCSVGLITTRVAVGGSIYYDETTKNYLGTRSEQLSPGVAGDFIGMAFYKKDFLENIGNDDFSIIPIWKRAQENGQFVKVVEVSDLYWKDAGSPQALAQIHFDVLEKRVALSLPPELIIDFENKRAYPKTVSPEQIALLGKNVWCEEAGIPPGVFIENSVILKGAKMPMTGRIKNILLTPWGELKLSTSAD